MQLSIYYTLGAIHNGNFTEKVNANWSKLTTLENCAVNPKVHIIQMQYKYKIKDQ
jgi:hypothetical protein